MRGSSEWLVAPLRAPFHAPFRMALIAAFVCSTMVFAPAALAEESMLSRFMGEWQLDPNEGAQDARRKAIDSAVAPLSWVIRVIAAPMLHRDTAPPERLVFFEKEDGWFQRSIAPNSDRVQPIRLDNAPHRHADPRGGEFSAVWKATEAGVELHWEQAQAVGSNQYHLDPVTGQLVVRQTIQVTEISDLEPIVLESRFDRAARPQGDAETSTDG